MKNYSLLVAVIICLIFACACHNEEKTDGANHEMNLCNTEFVFVEGGTFTMGCTEEQSNDCYNDEKPAHEETVKDFYIGKYEVTVEQFAKFIEETGYKTDAEKSLKTTIPFIKGHNLDYSDIMGFMGDYKYAAGWILFVIMTIFVVTAVSNGANLNDGMDGMCAGNSAIIGVAIGILAYVSSHLEYASYLNIMYIPGTQELVVFMCAFVGALIGFLWYNSYPAQVFMGDTGSLTIGGIIAVAAIIIHKELLLPILCGIFFVESLSVILQVWYYKRGKRRGVKQRIFKRTPIHDNFRTTPAQMEPDCRYLLKRPRGVAHESKITVRFWIISILLAVFAIITLKIR